MAVALRAKWVEEWVARMLHRLSIPDLCRITAEYLLPLDIQFRAVHPFIRTQTQVFEEDEAHICRYLDASEALTAGFGSVGAPWPGRLVQTISPAFKPTGWLVFQGLHPLSRTCSEWKMVFDGGDDVNPVAKVLFGIARQPSIDKFVRSGGRGDVIRIIEEGGAAIYTNSPGDINFYGKLCSTNNDAPLFFPRSLFTFGYAGCSVTIRIHHTSSECAHDKVVKVVNGASALASFTVEYPDDQGPSQADRVFASQADRVFALTTEELNDSFPIIVTDKMCRISISSNL